MRKTIIWMAAILAAATVAGAERPVNEARSVAADAEIAIENLAGSLRITGTEGTEVVVTGTLGDDVEELEISGDADRLVIEVAIPEGNRRRGERQITADLEVRVPRGVGLEVEAVSASIDISGVIGKIEAESVSGAVTVIGGLSDVEATSVSGAVSVTGGSGSIAAESVSGEVMLTDVSGDIEATTVSGKIRVEAGEVDDVEIESVAGSVYFKGRLSDGSLEVESHSGNVEVFLPADLSAEFELESFSGGIENGFGPPARRMDRYAPGLSAEFYTGAGTAEVSLETFSGNILLGKF